jgi:HlyD family secretion protein
MAVITKRAAVPLAVKLDRKWLGRGVLLLLALALAAVAWYLLHPRGLPTGISSGNGRIEATEIDVSAKIPGRIKEILVDEGDYVRAGQAVARIDTEALEAQYREALAQLDRSRIAVHTADSQLAQSRADKHAALATVRQRKAQVNAAERHYQRTRALAGKHAVSLQELDDAEARDLEVVAAVGEAEAKLAASDAGITTAQSQLVSARAAVTAAQATAERILADINDSVLKSPRDGRVQYRIMQPGEVAAPGGKVLNLVDLSDVYMTFFLPTDLAGRVAIGADARIVLDAAPELVIPAKVSYVSDVAQFTPKTVETREERQKLMFRVKARIPPELLRQHVRDVKTGLPGVTYVRADPHAEFPPELKVRLP